MYGIHRSSRQMNVDTTSRKLNIPKSKCLPLKLCVRLRGYVCYSGLGYLTNVQCCEVTGKNGYFFSYFVCLCVLHTACTIKHTWQTSLMCRSVPRQHHFRQLLIKWLFNFENLLNAEWMFSYNSHLIWSHLNLLWWFDEPSSLPKRWTRFTCNSIK